MKKNKIRNFSIIAHIDHGKSTLADRILELTNTIAKRDLTTQHLDQMELEQERGITIKLNAVQIKYKDYIFHLIDTPGHVDFTYEVSRSLAACEGALLVVDASQGIEAQTLANVYLAFENNLEIIVVINKIDLPSADPERVKAEIEEVIGIPADDAILISAKTGFGVDKLLEAIVEKIPCPKDNFDPKQPLKALIFDSYFDIFRGVILLIRVYEGEIKIGDRFKMFNTNQEFNVVELGVRTPKEIKKTKLLPGEVGWISASIREAKYVNVGDTITLVDNPVNKPLSGYKQLKSVLYTGFYPIDSNDYQLLKDSLEKIHLSDSSITYEPESSKALGFGFRCGFLGLLHMEIIKERIDREFNIPLITTSPSVRFKVFLTNGEMKTISNPSLLPDPTKINYIEEPYIKATIGTPKEYIGSIMQLCQNKRGNHIDMQYVDQNRVKIYYELPLVEIILDFFDKLKSYSKGYATFDYDFIGYKKSELVKMDLLLNKEKIDALSIIVHRDFAQKRGKVLVKRLKEVIPRQAFEIPIQASINNKIISRETIKAYRKDVTAKLYGGDVTRRKKLLDKQKKGKKRMKAFGKVNVPQEAFLAILKTED